MGLAVGCSDFSGDAVEVVYFFDRVGADGEVGVTHLLLFFGYCGFIVGFFKTSNVVIFFTIMKFLAGS